MKNTIGLIAPHEPEVLALLTQQRVTWQQARRHAVRRLLAGTPASQVAGDLQDRYGLWSGLAVRLVRQAQSLLHPQSPARAQYLAYLADCDDPAVTADEADFYRHLPGPADDALVAVDFRAPETEAEGGALQLTWLPKANRFHLALPVANPGSEPGQIGGIPVLFADEEAEELRRLSVGSGESRTVKAPCLELVWWQGQPHLVIGFDPDELGAYTAIRQPQRSAVATMAVAAALTVQAALPVGHAYAAEPNRIVVAAVNTPVVKVLDAATGRQLTGVRLVAEDGKVLARSDESGTLVLPNGYAKYNLFNLVKEGYQFMLLESTQLSPHNLLRVEMSPIMAKGQASHAVAPTTAPKKVTAPPSLPAQRPSTAAKPSAQVAQKPSTAPSKLTQALATATPKASATAKPQTAATAKPQATAAPKAQKPAPQPVAVKPAPVQTATPVPAASPVPKAVDGTYTVRPGDNLWLIAQRELGDGSRWLSLYQANRDVLRNPSQLEVGQVLRLSATTPKPSAQPTRQPVAESQPVAPEPTLVETEPTGEPLTERPVAEGTIYTVRRGDSLWLIAQRELGHGSRWMSLYQANRDVLRSPTQIFPGQKLKLVVAKAPAKAAKVQVRVRPGDSLSLIAQRRLGTIQRWQEIYELNRHTLKDPRLIFPGQTLWVPAK